MFLVVVQENSVRNKQFYLLPACQEQEILFLTCQPVHKIENAVFNACPLFGVTVQFPGIGGAFTLN